MLKTYKGLLKNGKVEPVDPLPAIDAEVLITVLDDGDGVEAQLDETQERQKAAIEKFLSLAGCGDSGDPKSSESIDAVLYGRKR